MPSSRSEEAKGVIVMFRGNFLDKIDAAMERMGYSDRSSLIRAAVYDLLEKHGVAVQPIDKTIPGRKGKGGRPPKEKKAELAPLPSPAAEKVKRASR